MLNHKRSEDKLTVILAVIKSMLFVRTVQKKGCQITINATAYMRLINAKIEFNHISASFFL